MEDASSSSSGRLNESDALEFTGKIMVGIIIVLSVVVVFIFFLHLYVKLSRSRRQETGDTRRQRREVNVQGLDPSILKTIPVVAFDAKEFKEGTLECTICLCDVCEGEKTRLLPKCNHGFHVDCIDMWFQSHSTCPVCRNPLSTTPEATGEEASVLASALATTELPNFPTNVLYWGNETQVSTLCPAPAPSSLSTASTSNRPHGTLAIDIPEQINEEESLKSAMPDRLRRLMRLLSGNRRVNLSSP